MRPHHFALLPHSIRGTQPRGDPYAHLQSKREDGLGCRWKYMPNPEPKKLQVSRGLQYPVASNGDEL